jgi:magnesium-transporting ATPase (P-type)
MAHAVQYQMGHVAGMLGSATTEITPLHQELAKISKLLGAIVIVVVIALMVIATIIAVETHRRSPCAVRCIRPRPRYGASFCYRL